jgi:hypothetical protein
VAVSFHVDCKTQGDERRTGIYLLFVAKVAQVYLRVALEDAGSVKPLVLVDAVVLLWTGPSGE